MTRGSFSGTVPPQDGLQPVLSASANASVKCFWPVAFATSRSAGLAIVMSTYGEKRPPPDVPPPPAASVVAPTLVLKSDRLPAASFARTLNGYDIDGLRPDTVALVPVTVVADDAPWYTS
jgi:hypothetical protein